MKKIILILSLTIISPAYSANIFDNMSEESAVSTGIHKLSHNEKEALAKWLENSHKEVREVSREVIKQEVRSEIIAENEHNEKLVEKIIQKEKVKNMGFNTKETERAIISTSIMKITEGYDRKFTYTLANDQVWKQTDTSKLFISKKNPNPNVSLKPKSMNSWTLYVDGLSRGVKVKRIK